MQITSETIHTFSFLVASLVVLITFAHFSHANDSNWKSLFFVAFFHVRWIPAQEKKRLQVDTEWMCICYVRSSFVLNSCAFPRLLLYYLPKEKCLNMWSEKKLDVSIEEKCGFFGFPLVIEFFSFVVIDVDGIASW